MVKIITDTVPSPNRILGFTLSPIIPARMTPPKTNFDKSKV